MFSNTNGATRPETEENVHTTSFRWKDFQGTIKNIATACLNDD
jgi:hypothetical protein